MRRRPRHIAIRLAIVIALSLAGARCAPAPSPSLSPSVPASHAAAAVSAAASSAPPSQLVAPTASTTVLQAAVYDGSPPRAVVAWLQEVVRIGFRPLTAEELASVTITRAKAVRAAMAVPGLGYGPGNDHFTWTKTGCVYLGVYTGPPEPSIGYEPPTFPAYLVQVIAKPAQGFPWQNVEIGVVDARTGAASPFFGYSEEPILGTTCGVTP